MLREIGELVATYLELGHVLASVVVRRALGDAIGHLVRGFCVDNERNIARFVEATAQIEI